MIDRVVVLLGDLGPRAFYGELNQTIWGAIVELHSANVGVDSITVATRLRESGAWTEHLAKHLAEIEGEMRKICKEKLKLERFELPREEALRAEVWVRNDDVGFVQGEVLQQRAVVQPVRPIGGKLDAGAGQFQAGLLQACFKRGHGPSAQRRAALAGVNVRMQAPAAAIARSRQWPRRWRR